MAKIICPGCGAEIDTEKLTAEFRQPSEDHRDDTSLGDPQPVAAPRQRGNAFFRPRKKE